MILNSNELSSGGNNTQKDYSNLIDKNLTLELFLKNDFVTKQ